MERGWANLNIADFRTLVDGIMQRIDKEWNNPGECERRMISRMKLMYPCDISHCKMWSENMMRVT